MWGCYLFASGMLLFEKGYCLNWVSHNMLFQYSEAYSCPWQRIRLFLKITVTIALWECCWHRELWIASVWFHHVVMNFFLDGDSLTSWKFLNDATYEMNKLVTNINYLSYLILPAIDWLQTRVFLLIVGCTNNRCWYQSQPYTAHWRSSHKRGDNYKCYRSECRWEILENWCVEQSKHYQYLGLKIFWCFFPLVLGQLSRHTIIFEMIINMLSRW